MLWPDESAATSAAISRLISPAMALPSMICAIGVPLDSLSLLAATTTESRVLFFFFLRIEARVLCGLDNSEPATYVRYF